jgi:NTP pyrophosphatase (non-canonical NTP hydrolase)
MYLNEYQERAARTLGSYDGLDDMALMAKTGLIAEAGEALDCYKKIVWRQDEAEKDKLILELGDLAFYLAAYFTSRGDQLQKTQAYPTSGLVCSGIGSSLRGRLVNLVRLTLLFDDVNGESKGGRDQARAYGWAILSEVHAIALGLGHTLDEVFRGNLDKLARRFKGRFTPEEAKAKADMMSPVELKLRDELSALRAELDRLGVSK